MKLSVPILCLTLFAAAPGAHAESSVDKKVESIKKWFKHWRLALKRSAVEGRYRRTNTTAVAAVRGAGQADEDPMAPYWKGTWSAKKNEERLKERAELEAAVDLILEEKYDEAASALDAFEEAHPSSTMLKDVAEARENLAALKGDPPAAQTAPETPAEEAVQEEAKAEEVPEQTVKEEASAPEESPKSEEAPETAEAPSKEEASAEPDIESSSEKTE